MIIRIRRVALAQCAVKRHKCPNSGGFASLEQPPPHPCDHHGSSRIILGCWGPHCCVAVCDHPNLEKMRTARPQSKAPAYRLSASPRPRTSSVSKSLESTSSLSPERVGAVSRAGGVLQLSQALDAPARVLGMLSPQAFAKSWPRPRPARIRLSDGSTAAISFQSLELPAVPLPFRPGRLTGKCSISSASVHV